MNFGTSMHWLYQQYRYLWWFWGQSYRGGEGMRLASATSAGLKVEGGNEWQASRLEDVTTLQRRFLWGHERESEGDYSQRLARSRYMRYAGYAVDVRAAGVTEGAALPTSKLDKEWLKDADGRGGTYRTCRSRWCARSQVYGAYHVGADVQLGGNPKTSRRKPGLPYLYEINPLDMPIWGPGPQGRLAYAVVRERANAPATPPWKEGGSMAALSAPTYVYRAWTPDEVVVFDSAGREIEWINSEGKAVTGVQPNKLGRVPIETVYFRRHEEYPDEPVGQSWLEDPALVNLWHYNLLSLRDTVVTDTAFPFLAWPTAEGETQLPPNQELDIGTKQAVAYFGQKPEWIQPSPDAVVTISTLITESIRAIRELAGLTIDSEGSQEAHSAEALALMRANLDASFGEHARAMEDAEARIVRMACEIANINPDAVEVKYPEDYGSQEAGTRTADIVAALDGGLRAIPTANALLLKDMFRAILPGAKAEDVTKAETEIDGMGVTAEPEAAPTDPAAPATEEAKVQDTAMNGAQISGLLEIVKAVAAEEIPRESGIGMLMAAYQIDKAQAEAIMGSAGKGFEPVKPDPPPSPFGGGPPKPGEPAEKPDEAPKDEPPDVEEPDQEAA